MSTNEIPNLDQIETLAQAAGQILRNHFGKNHNIQYKGVIDPVTEADRLSETYILNIIRSSFPEHRIISEEAGSNRMHSRYCWYIDPLDGTVNYSHGIPIYSVSIAFAVDEKVELAAICDPAKQELFSAARGRGAFLNGSPVALAPTQELIHSLLVTGFPYDMATTTEDNLGNYGNLAKKSQGVRRLGSAALDCCYVSCGRFDGYWELDVQPWDVAAGTLLVEEAGGMVSNANGDAFQLKPHASILCASPRMHSLLRQEIHSSR